MLILIFVWVGSRFRSATREKTTSIKISITPTPTKAQKNNWNPLGFLFNSATKTPTPKVTGKITPKTTTIQVTKIVVKNGQNKSITYLPTQTTLAQVEYRNNKTGVKQIPSTGAATIAIPLAFSALSLGVYLRRKV